MKCEYTVSTVWTKTKSIVKFVLNKKEMNKIITVKIKAVLEWGRIRDCLYGYDEKEYPVFQIKKNTLYELYCYGKQAGSFNTLKNAKACAELIYGG